RLQGPRRRAEFELEIPLARDRPAELAERQEVAEEEELVQLRGAEVGIPFRAAGEIDDQLAKFEIAHRSGPPGRLILHSWERKFKLFLRPVYAASGARFSQGDRPRQVTSFCTQPRQPVNSTGFSSRASIQHGSLSSIQGRCSVPAS